MQGLSNTLSANEQEDEIPLLSYDALTNKEVDLMSARLTRIEEILEEQDTKMTASAARIAALEKENSLLIGKINSVASELSVIKEMLAKNTESKGKGFVQKSSTRVAPTSTQKALGTDGDTASGSISATCGGTRSEDNSTSHV